MILSLALALAVAASPAEVGEVVARMGAPAPERLAQAERICRVRHALDEAQLLRLAAEGPELHRAFAALALDEGRPLFVRARATSLLGVRADALAFAVWRAQRRAPERELRVQAAWAEGLARGETEPGRGFARALLDSPDRSLREVGIQLLARGASPAGLAAIRAHNERERDARLRALIHRRLGEGRRSAQP
jgi:hypothetical protein